LNGPFEPSSSKTGAGSPGCGVLATGGYSELGSSPSPRASAHCAASSSASAIAQLGAGAPARGDRDPLEGHGGDERDVAVERAADVDRHVRASLLELGRFEQSSE
jgi:hypothetical protein